MNQATSIAITKAAGTFPYKPSQWKKGQSGNPYGNKGMNKSNGKGLLYISCKLQKFGEWKTPRKFLDKMRELFPDMSEKITIEESVWLRVWVSALQGESWAVEFIADRVYGKVKTSVDVTSKGQQITAAPLINVMNSESATLVQGLINNGIGNTAVPEQLATPSA